jgi:hypothetical protein
VSVIDFDPSQLEVDDQWTAGDADSAAKCTAFPSSKVSEPVLVRLKIIQVRSMEGPGS